MQRSQSDDIAWYASHGPGRVIRNLRSNAAVRAYSCTKAYGLVILRLERRLLVWITSIESTSRAQIRRILGRPPNDNAWPILR
jgi:hypothetical protein